MAFIGSMFGITPNTGSGEAGIRYQAPVTGIQTPVTQEQLNEQYQNAQRGIQQQQAFIQAMQGASPQLFQQQQALTDQLIAASQGGGPNPALEQLRQTTGQNVAGQAALMAGQRGAGANVGLIGRQAAQQGAATQQQAVGQAAALAAQQQIAARQQLQSQFGQQVGQQQGALTGYNQAAQSEQATLLGAKAQADAARVQAQAAQTAANARIAGIQAQNQGQLFGNVLGGAGTAMMAMHGGGQVPGYAEGGPVSAAGRYLYGSAPTLAPVAQPVTSDTTSDLMSDKSAAQGEQRFGQAMGTGLRNLFSSSGSPEAMEGGAATGSVTAMPLGAGAGAAGPAAGAMMIPLAKGGMPIHGESYAKSGKVVPGKAAVKGDSLKNDNVPAMLSPGEIIIPRSIAQHPEAPKKAAEFVSAVLAKNGPRKKR